MAKRAKRKVPELQDDLDCLAKTIAEKELRYYDDRKVGNDAMKRIREAADRCDPQRQQRAVDETMAWLLADDGSPYHEACRARPDIAGPVADLHRAALNGMPDEADWRIAADRACEAACPAGLQAGPEEPDNLERMVCCMALLDWSPGKTARQVAWRFALAACELAAPEDWREHWIRWHMTIWLDVCEQLVGCLGGNRELWNPDDCPVPRTRFSFWRIDYLKFLRALLLDEDSPISMCRSLPHVQSVADLIETLLNGQEITGKQFRRAQRETQKPVDDGSASDAAFCAMRIFGIVWGAHRTHCHHAAVLAVNAAGRYALESGSGDVPLFPDELEAAARQSAWQWLVREAGRHLIGPYARAAGRQEERTGG